MEHINGTHNSDFRFSELRFQIYKIRNLKSAIWGGERKANLLPTHQAHGLDFRFQSSTLDSPNFEIWNLKSEFSGWEARLPPTHQTQISDFRFRNLDLESLALQATTGHPLAHRIQISDFGFQIWMVWLFKQQPITHSHTELRFQISDFAFQIWMVGLFKQQLATHTHTPNSDFRFPIPDL